MWIASRERSSHSHEIAAFQSQSTAARAGLPSAWAGLHDHEPVTARFVEADPIGLGGSTTASMGIYSYASQNPQVNVDPTGLFDVLLPMPDDLAPAQMPPPPESPCQQMCYAEFASDMNIDVPVIGSGLPILPKPPYLGSRPGTSVASVTFRTLLPISIPPVLNSPVLGGAVGRAVPFAGYGMTLIDLGKLMNCMQSCKSCSSPGEGGDGQKISG